MKKIYILAFSAMFATVSFAQRAANQVPFSFDMDKAIQVNGKAAGDTIYSHLSGTPTVYISTGGGYVGGQNQYGDIAKMQKFDATHGLTSNVGTIENLLMWFGHVEYASPNSTFQATIWADNAGQPGTILGTTTLPYTAVDTNLAAQFTNGIVAWNGIATFSPAISIPTSQIFWAGIEFIEATGDSLGLVTNTDGDFPDASTHTFEQWGDLSFHSFNDGTTNTWQLDVALGLFPVMNYTVGIEEVNELSFNVYPNPSAGVFNINLSSEAAGAKILTVKNVVGQTIIDKTIAVSGKTIESISLTNYSKGIYFLTIDNKTVKLIVE